MKKKIKSILPWVIAVPVAMLVLRRLTGQKRMPRLPLWRRELRKHYGSREGCRLSRQARWRYQQLYHSRKRFSNGELQRHHEQQILPALAMYQVLKEHGVPQETALQDMQHLLGISFGPALKILALMRFLPNPFAFFRRALKPRMSEFPAEGWETEWVEDSDQAVAFNMRRCFYLDELSQLGAPELTAAFCHTDEVIASVFPNAIRFVRKGTLALGEECCDFRYERTA